MRNIIELMSFYARYHHKTITKITHFIGVPMIILAIQIIFSWVHFSFKSMPISAAWLALIIILIYYACLDIYLMIISAIFFIPLTILAQTIAGKHFSYLSFISFLMIFFIGWIIQLIGHYVEGKRPSFFDDFFQIVIAPIFLIAELCFIFGFRTDLQQKIKQNNL